jgi:hexosaminidase
MYDLNTAIPNIKAKILGGEACLWSEVSNENTHHQKMWPRASSTIERLWNTHVTTGTYAGIVNRLS